MEDRRKEMRFKWSTVTLVGVLAYLSFIAFLYLQVPPPSAAYERIEAGMTLAEVKEVLGSEADWDCSALNVRPEKYYGPPYKITIRPWEVYKGVVLVAFDADEKAIEKMLIPLDEGFWGKIYRRTKSR